MRQTPYNDMKNCEENMRDDEHHCCKARISDLMSRVCHMEMMLERVLGQMGLVTMQQQLDSTYADSSSCMETVIPGQPDSAPSIPLQEAAELKDTVALVRGLARGADPNAVDIRGSTALHCAARSGDALAVELLLACGAMLDVQDVCGASPLSIAILEERTNVVRVLLEKGANIELHDEMGRTPLMLAFASGNMYIMNVLTKNSTSLGIRESLLITASRFGLTDYLNMLIDSLQPSGKQLLEAISVASSSDVAVILLRRTPKKAICSTRFHLLLQFAKEDWWKPIAMNLEICKHCKCMEHLRNLQQAIAICISEDILLLLWSHQQIATCAIAMERCVLKTWSNALENILVYWMSNGEPNTEIAEALRVAKDPRIVFLLVSACPYAMRSTVTQEMFWQSVEQGNFAVLESLLQDSKFPMDLMRSDGSSALHCAAARGHAVCMELLIKYGASVDLTDDDGWTPLHVAAERGQRSAVQVLLSAGANPKIKDQCGLMPSNIAGTVEVLKLLNEFNGNQD